MDILVRKTLQAAALCNVKTVLMAGGVSANSRLREKMTAACKEAGLLLSYPPLKYCTDNAAMIGAAAYAKLLRGEHDDLNLIGSSRMPLFL